MIHMSKGAKVLKDLLSHKDKLEKAASSVKLNEEFSAVIQRSLPQKEGDPWSFTLLCLIGPLTVKTDLADLGASINLMPHSLFRRLGIFKLKQTRMSIQLADRSIKYPVGLIREQWVDTVDHDEEWIKTEEGRDLDELKELPGHLVYAFLQEDNQLLVVISSALSATEKAKLLEVVPKKGEMTVVKNEKNELIPQRTGIGWHMCIDYNDDDFTEMYSHQFSESFREEQSPVKEVEEIEVPDSKKKPLEEETALCKGWLRTSEYSVVGNARKEMGFWVEVLKHMHATCPITKRRTYDMVNVKWKTVRPKVASFCGVYANTIRTYTSGAGGANYLQRALTDYQVQYIVPFTLLHRREVLKQRDKLNSREVSEYLQEWKEKKNKGYKSSGSSSVNTKESGEGRINLNTIRPVQRSKEPRNVGVIADKKQELELRVEELEI
ncbi:reverse transcriptase domain-containing protein [Tanacetum coccineum]